jgi:hypothetical protein
LAFFQQIAAATGGQVYETDKDHIGNVLNEVLETDYFFLIYTTVHISER